MGKLYINSKAFCTAKKAITKRQLTEWEKIFANDETDEINLQGLWTPHVAQYQKNKSPNQKIGRRPRLTFLPKRHTDDQETHEKMLDTANY